MKRFPSRAWARNVSTTGTAVTPWGYNTFNNWYSPFTGASYGQSYYSNLWGTTAARSYGYNPWFGSYGTNYYQPNAFVNPFGFGYGSSYYYPSFNSFGPYYRPGFNISPGYVHRGRW